MLQVFRPQAPVTRRNLSSEPSEMSPERLVRPEWNFCQQKTEKKEGEVVGFKAWWERGFVINRRGIIAKHNKTLVLPKFVYFGLCIVLTVPINHMGP
jgi:hypothetical protein